MIKKIYFILEFSYFLFLVKKSLHNHTVFGVFVFLFLTSKSLAAKGNIDVLHKKSHIKVYFT